MASSVEVLKGSSIAGPRADRLFFSGMSSAMLLTMFAGFADKYYFSSSVHLKSLPLLVHLHAAAFTAWVILLWLQTALIAVGRPDIHRRLGLISVAMYIVMIVLGIKTAIFGAQNGWSPGGPFHDSLGFLVVGLVDLLLFSIFVISGLWFRRHKEAHKRLMILAAIGGLLWPSITRVSIVAGRFPLMMGLLALFVIAGPLYDLITRKRVHIAYLIGCPLILASFPVRTAIGLSQWWHNFAGWLIN